MSSLLYFLLHFKICIITYLLNIQQIHGFGMNLIKVAEEDQAEIVCTLALLRKYYSSGDSLSGSILSMSFTSASINTQENLLKAIHAEVDFPWTVTIKNLRKEHSAPTPSTMVLHEKPQSYFVVIEHVEADDLEVVFSEWKTNINWNPLAQFVVYMSAVEETDEAMTELMIDILLSFMNRKIYNVNVIGQNEENGFFYGKSVFPFHPDNNCGNRVISIETLDVCDYQNKEIDYDDDIDNDNEDYGDEAGIAEDNNDDEGGNNGDAEEDQRAEADANEEATDNETVNREENDEAEQQNGNDKEESEANEEDKLGNEDNGDDTNTEAAERERDDEHEEDTYNEVGEGKKENTDSVDNTNNVETPDENENIDKIEAEENVSNGENATKNQSNSQDDYEDTTGESDNADEVDNGNYDVNGDIRSNYVYEEAKTASIIDNTDMANRLKSGLQIAKSEISEKDAKIHGKKRKSRYMKYVGNIDKISKSGDNGNIEENQETADNPYDNMRDNTHRDDEEGVGRVDESENNSGNDDESYKENKVDEKEDVMENTDNSADEEPNINVGDEGDSKIPDEQEENTVNEHDGGSHDEDYRDSKTVQNNAENQTKEVSQKLYLEEHCRALFLDKFPKDLSGCSLIAAFRPMEPYIYSETSEEEEQGAGNDTEDGYSYRIEQVEDAVEDYQDDNGEPVLKLRGIEYEILQTIGEVLHLSINVQQQSSNLYHLFQQLMDGDIEMVFGGIDEDPTLSQYVSSTIAYHQDDLTWCVAKAKRHHSIFNFLESFSLATWLLIQVYIVATSLSVSLAQRVLKVPLRQLRSTILIWLRINGFTLNQPIRLYTDMPIPLKIALGTTFFMGLLFSNIYQSILVSTLTTPESSYQISHLKELYRYRMTVMGSVENVRHLNKDGEIFKYLRETFQICYNIEECLKSAATDEDIAVAVSRQHSFYNPRIPRDHLYCFDRDENIYVYLITMLMPKKFHLLHKINPIIQHVIESGHIQKWARDLDMKRKIFEEIHRVHEDPFKSLTLEEVTGSFVFAGALLICATVAFLLERCIYWLVIKRRTRLKIAKMLHRKFK